MHSLDCKNGTTFHFNGDLSGEVVVTRKAGCSNSTATRMLPEIKFDDGVVISGEDILQLAADYVRMHRIRVLERSSNAEILGGLGFPPTSMPRGKE